MTWVYLLNKNPMCHVFQVFFNMIKTQFGVKIRGIRTDNAKDYFNQTLSSYFEKEGNVHQSSCVDSPQQNGVAERKNRHLLEVTRALIFQNHVPKNYWGEAILTSSYLINRLPSRVIDFKSPLNYMSEFFPMNNFYSKLPPKIFGCVFYVHNHKYQRSKLDPRALRCIFVGYSTTQKGYKCYHPTSRKFFVSKDVTFDGKTIVFQPK